jgi:hypothetical protein
MKTIKAQSKEPKFHGLVPLMLFIILIIVAMIVLKFLIGYFQR